MALRRFRLVAIVVLALVALAAAPARAIGSFGPPVGVYDPPCSFDDFSVDAAQDTAGIAHGFARLGGGGCGNDPSIRYFEGSGGTWTVETTPYHGFVMGVAWDTTGTYLLYLDIRPGQGVRITKRLTDGTYTGGRVLSHNWASSLDTQGDVVATGGRWWAVWTEFVGASRPQLDLFQAYTIGGTAHGRQRITNNPLWDWGPKLALTPGSTFPLTLVWVRGNTEGETETQTDLRRALGYAAGSWSSSTLASLGFSNFWPDVAVVGTTTYLTWIRDGRAMFADNQSGRFVSRQFNTPVIPHGPSHVAVAGGVVYAGWTATVNRTFVASRVGGVWDGAFASPAGVPRFQFLVGLAPSAGKATALNISLTSRLYATTET
jgi:hypothetical protein